MEGARNTGAGNPASAEEPPNSPQTLRGDHDEGGSGWTAKVVDNLLSKYISVWLWSITLGATSALSFVFTNSSFSRGEWGPLSFALALGTLLGMLVTLAAWMQLLFYLRYFLIPRLILRRPLPDEEEAAAATSLVKAFRYMILGVLLSLFLAFARLAFEAFQWPWVR